MDERDRDIPVPRDRIGSGQECPDSSRSRGLDEFEGGTVLASQPSFQDTFDLLETTPHGHVAVILGTMEKLGIPVRCAPQEVDGSGWMEVDTVSHGEAAVVAIFS